MLRRTDLLAASVQDKNAGNSGDLVKHATYLCMLGCAPFVRRAQVIEAHAGKGIYVSSHRHLLTAMQSTEYWKSELGQAQKQCFEEEPIGVGIVEGLENSEVAYAGSAALHTMAMVEGKIASLKFFDCDEGVRQTLGRVLGQDCFLPVRDRIVVERSEERSEKALLEWLKAGSASDQHIVHFDPFAFVMAETDADMRSTYAEILRECGARVRASTLGAVTVFFTWGSNGAAALADLDGNGYRNGISNGYKALVSLIPRENCIVVNWCWEFYFSLLLVVEERVKNALVHALETETRWLNRWTRRLEIC